MSFCKSIREEGLSGGHSTWHAPDLSGLNGHSVFRNAGVGVYGTEERGARDIARLPTLVRGAGHACNHGREKDIGVDVPVHHGRDAGGQHSDDACIRDGGYGLVNLGTSPIPPSSLPLFGGCRTVWWQPGFSRVRAQPTTQRLNHYISIDLTFTAEWPVIYHDRPPESRVLRSAAGSPSLPKAGHTTLGVRCKLSNTWTAFRPGSRGYLFDPGQLDEPLGDVSLENPGQWNCRRLPAAIAAKPKARLVTDAPRGTIHVQGQHRPIKDHFTSTLLTITAPLSIAHPSYTIHKHYYPASQDAENTHKPPPICLSLAFSPSIRPKRPTGAMKTATLVNA